MTPIKQDIVDAAKRAGILVEDIRGELSIAFTGNAFLIYMDNDTRPGSALFIVAVLGVLPRADARHAAQGSWRVHDVVIRSVATLLGTGSNLWAFFGPLLNGFKVQPSDVSVGRDDPRE